MEEFLEGQRLLVIAPHPDDEALGCGGIIKKVKELGGQAYALYITTSSVDHQYDETYPQTDLAQRLEEIAAVAAHLGIDDYEVALVGREYHLRLNTLPQDRLVDIIESETKVSLNRIEPTVVAIPAPDHYHQDHRAVFEAAFAALRPVPRQLKPFAETVLFYEQPCYNWSINRLQPNFYVDITRQLEAKLEAVRLHHSQLRHGLHVRALDNVRRLAEARGREVAVAAAEAFICHRFLA